MVIKVRAPAHLHTGNPDLSGDMGRLFGTLGFAIEYPYLEIEVSEAGKDKANDRDALKFLERLRGRHEFPPGEIQLK
ncbi:hypothetical protein [Pyrococcus kukulkanii]|uniref:hypothetical protein n=1 Tax=Pyrococcus kukulkanii TaxID=1609559 RepID=UPI00356760CF